ncbi:hypothetical protein Vqi01_55300 [Micromonospora qiuiae]|uniref:Lipoprotein n=2 Tax=Micromonospora qiuiae TaxID=502268 RepID=A0ABQ4JIE1_9ACTN|nr:hypothetical protein Vqi01_55300 [Micromonospora qiuiae]
MGLLGVLLVAGCGGGAGKTSVPPVGDAAGAGAAEDTDRRPGAMLTVDLNVTGDAEVSGSTVYGPVGRNLGLTAMSCSEFSKGQEIDGVRLFAFPALIGAEPIGGKEILVTVGVWEYPGAGTYTEKDNLQTSPDEVGLNIDGSIFSLPYDDPSTTLVIEADGSGVWNFPRLDSLDGGSVSGAMTWTCRD